MTLILQKNKIKKALFLVLIIFAGLPFWVSAQMSQSLSVSPTIFDMTVEPSQRWQSSLRVINPNPYDLKIYLTAVNFRPKGEGGQPEFLSAVSDETGKHTLAEWLSFRETEFTISAEQIYEVPFQIDVPEGVSPGGHFAAIMVGTQPIMSAADQPRISTSQVVTSLLFLRVTGDILESGSIRSFRTTKWLLDKPEATFELRFENTGNIHIQPQGSIVIRNMWGEERGVIPVNREALYGNVLPESIRKFNYIWTGEWSLADIGYYTAEVTLAYGETERQSVSSEIGFWVIPWKPFLVILILLFGFVSFITWAIKAYIRRMLNLAGIDSQYSRISVDGHQAIKRASLTAPIEVGILDLRRQMRQANTWRERVVYFGDFVTQYRLFIVAVVAIVLFLVAIVWYVKTASVAERAYEIVISNESGEISISSEQLKYESLRRSETANTVATSTDTKTVSPASSISIVNRSGVNGLAASLRLVLENAGYNITGLTTELGVVENNTVIVYAPEYVEEALALSRQIEGALLSAYAEALVPITVYVGQDYKNAVQ
jgi:hypothetical protein